MDSEIFIKNVKKYCDQKQEPPTVVCKNAGIGHGFMTEIKRGQKPSVERVQQLAQYLGVTTSDLLGEQKPAGNETSGLSKEMIEIIELYDKASPETQAAALGMLRAAEAARSAPGAQKGGK